jgi:spermidine/putrescine transport system substrate-binding protein
MLLNDSREVFSMVLLSLGYSINDRDPKHIKQVYNKLIELLPNIKLFNNDAVASTYIDEDATMGMAWNGDAYLASKENPNIVYTYPKEGFVIWIDCFALPKYAPHLENSYRFINFLLRPDISEIITRAVGFSTPNQAAYNLLPPEIRNNPMQYPDKKLLLKKGQYQRYLGGPLTALYEKYWELLKTR